MNKSTLDKELRRQLIATLRGGNAFDAIEKTLQEIPSPRRFEIPRELQRSAWQILEHMRRTLEDINAYSQNWDGGYRELRWPEDYWPAERPTQPDEAWQESLDGFTSAKKMLEATVEDPSRDLVAPFPWEKKHTLLREALLAIEHNAYHAGELVEVGRALQKS